MKILIVDDEEVNVLTLEAMLQEYLREIGVIEHSTVDVAYDGEEALVKEKQNGYDLILMDIMMPKMDGLEATRQIRLLDLKKQPIIIMITSLNDADTMREGFFSGANWYLTKPLNMDELVVLINDVVAGKILSSDTKRVYDAKKKIEKEESAALAKKQKAESQESDDGFIDFDDESSDDGFMEIDGDGGDEFFDFDSEEVDGAIDTMQNHAQTVSAAEFMQEGVVDEYELQDLQDALEHYYQADSSKEVFIQNIEDLLESFIKLLNSTYVFQNLAYGLQSLLLNLKAKDFESMPDETFALYKELLDAVAYDLQKWVDEVLIYQSARDIHYLDAAILANSSQIDMLLKQN